MRTAPEFVSRLWRAATGCILNRMDAAKVVLVTNVGQGYGRAAALALGAAGHDVVCADRDVDQASKTAAEIEEAGGQAIPVQGDMSTQLDVMATFHKVYEIFGELDGVVHVATHTSNAPFRNLADNEVGELFDENLRSTFLIMKSAVRLHSDHLWLVIVAPPRNAVEPQMMALQGALRGLSESFNRRHERIRCNVVIPSRAASDPVHDAALAETVIFLGMQGHHGIGGQAIEVELPPPPRITESLLPEVRAALDTNVRQDDLLASHFAEEDEDDEEGGDQEGFDDDSFDEDDGFEDDGEPGTNMFDDYLDDHFEYEEYVEDLEQGFLFGTRREPQG